MHFVAINFTWIWLQTLKQSWGQTLPHKMAVAHIFSAVYHIKSTHKLHCPVQQHKHDLARYTPGNWCEPLSHTRTSWAWLKAWGFGVWEPRERSCWEDKKKAQRDRVREKARQGLLFWPLGGPAAAAFSIQMHDTELIQSLVNIATWGLEKQTWSWGCAAKTNQPV